jgi:hypothetical protein
MYCSLPSSRSRLSRSSRYFSRSVIEPYHQLAYRSPEAQAAYAAVGLDRPDLQYFGGRLCALGPISVEVACAVLFGFAPDYVAEAVPEVWTRATPADIADARLRGADATLRRVLGDVLDDHAIGRGADIARTVADACDLGARPMAAAHRSLPWPDDPGLVLWHACTILREHRGDAHWVATSALGLDSVECHALHAADGHMPDDLLQRVTGWDDDAWAAAWDRLRGRGLVDGDTTTPDGAAPQGRARAPHRRSRAPSVADGRGRRKRPSSEMCSRHSRRPSPRRV